MGEAGLFNPPYDSGTGLYISGDFEYSVSNGKAEIGLYTGPDYADVIIPSSLGGYPVTSIGYYGGALIDCWPFMRYISMLPALPKKICARPSNTLIFLIGYFCAIYVVLNIPLEAT